MHSPLEIARNFVEIGIHKVKLSAWKMLILGFFAGMFIGFAELLRQQLPQPLPQLQLQDLSAHVYFPPEWLWFLLPEVNFLPEII